MKKNLYHTEKLNKMLDSRIEEIPREYFPKLNRSEKLKLAGVVALIGGLYLLVSSMDYQDIKGKGNEYQTNHTSIIQNSNSTNLDSLNWKEK